MSTRSSFAALLIAKTGLSFSSLNYFESFTVTTDQGGAADFKIVCTEQQHWLITMYINMGYHNWART